MTIADTNLVDMNRILWQQCRMSEQNDYCMILMMVRIQERNQGFSGSLPPSTENFFNLLGFFDKKLPPSLNIRTPKQADHYGKKNNKNLSNLSQ